MVGIAIVAQNIGGKLISVFSYRCFIIPDMLNIHRLWFL